MWKHRHPFQPKLNLIVSSVETQITAKETRNKTEISLQNLNISSHKREYFGGDDGVNLINILKMGLNVMDLNFDNWEEKSCYLWNNKEVKYALVKEGSKSPVNYSIYSLTNYFFVMLDADIKVANLIIDKMIDNNVTVFESSEDFDDFKNNNPVILQRPIGYPLNKKW